MRTKSQFASVLSPPNDNYWNQSTVLGETAYLLEIEKNEANLTGPKIASKTAESLRSEIKSLIDLEKQVKFVVHEGASFCGMMKPVGKTIYISIYGEGACYLKRGDQTAKLLDGTGSISGHCQEGDIYFIASGKLIKTVGENELLVNFDHLTPQETAEKITLDLHTKENPQGTGIIYQIQEFEEESREYAPVYKTSFDYRELPVKRIVLRGFKALKERRIPGLWRVKRRLNRVRSEPTAIYASIAIVFVVIFIISVLLGIRRDMAQKNNTKNQETITQIKSLFEEAMAIRDLNPERGRELITQASDVARSAQESIPPKTKEGRDLGRLIDDIDANTALILKKIEIEPQLFYDVELLKKGSTISDIAIWEDEIVLLDSIQKSVYSLKLTDKNASIAGGGSDIPDYFLVTSGPDKKYILSTGGIYEIGLSKNPKLVIKKSEDWGEIRDMLYFGANIYLLDATKNKIWKYTGQENGFSDIREYLVSDAIVNFSASSSMAIDGSVFVAATGGKIMKFVQGREVTYVLVGVTPPAGQNLKIYADDTLNNAYLLDLDNKRIIVLDKEGKYVAQYIWTGDIAPANFVVSEKHKKVILLNKGLLYSFDLK